MGQEDFTLLRARTPYLCWWLFSVLSNRLSEGLGEGWGILGEECLAATYSKRLTPNLWGCVGRELEGEMKQDKDLHQHGCFLKIWQLKKYKKLQEFTFYNIQNERHSSSFTEQFCKRASVLQEGFRTALKQLPGAGHDRVFWPGLGADEVSLVISSTPLALQVGRRRSWAVGMLNLRKPQGKCKRARYGSLPSRGLQPGNDEGRLPPTGQVPGSPHAGLSQRDFTGKGGFLRRLVASLPAHRQKLSTCSQQISVFLI